jgi:uncharacterized protein (TIGR02996 family)
MTHEDAFLRAVLAEPDDDAPRLIYADWLEERNDPRGEFIRIQCELARIPADDPRRKPLRAREQELEGRHRRAWLGRLHSLAYLWGFRRGFAEEVALPAHEFLAHADTFFRATPVRLARLINAGRCVADLADSPHLRRLTALHLTDNQVGTAGVWLLAGSRHVAGLTTLRLGNNGIDDEGAEALAGSPHLARLTTLNLSHNSIGTTGARALADSPYLGALTCLDLTGNPVGEAGVQALAESRYLRRLTTLALSHGHRLGPKHRQLLRERFGAGAAAS